MGPEHEFSIVDDELKPLPIADKVLKHLKGRITNTVTMPRYTYGKELQLHVLEMRPNAPFKSPREFEETMQDSVLTINHRLHRSFKATMLGTGMHPLLKLEQTSIWSHRDRRIYEAYGRIFDLNRHGWLNIQSYQLNLPYANEREGVLLHNYLAIISAYLPAIAASSPIYEGAFGKTVDNRLAFYANNQKEIPSIAGDVVPEYTYSFRQYKNDVIGTYSADLAEAGSDKILLNMEWVNSRGVIMRFGRRAIELRVMDEQECIKSDVALSCFVFCLAKAMIRKRENLYDHQMLVNDFNSVVRRGLEAKVHNPYGPTARNVLTYFLHLADDNATPEESSYLRLVKKRIEHGSLSDLIRRAVFKESKKTNLKEAIITVYSSLIECLLNNEPYL